MKICSKCKISKIDSLFPKKGDKLASNCRDCVNASVRNHYNNNKEYYSERNLKRKKENREFVIDYLKNNPCVKCGESDILVLDFDHIDPLSKKKSVSMLINESTLNIVKSEIEKCQVLCANCHRRKTAKEFNWYKLEID